MDIRANLEDNDEYIIEEDQITAFICKFYIKVCLPKRIN